MSMRRIAPGMPIWAARIQLHRRWLAGLKFEQAVHHIVLEDYIAAVEAVLGEGRGGVGLD